MAPLSLVWSFHLVHSFYTLSGALSRPSTKASSSCSSSARASKSAAIVLSSAVCPQRDHLYCTACYCNAAYFSDTHIFSTRYTITCKVYTGYHATSKTEQGFLPVRSITHSLKLVGYFSTQADNYALSSTQQQFTGCSYSCQPHDCQEIKDFGHRDSGVYHITPLSAYSGFDVYCDMSTDDGGWLVSLLKIFKYFLS